jgi:glutathione synthase/RimK-type ligase-like ATP-grasp enzyme
MMSTTSKADYMHPKTKHICNPRLLVVSSNKWSTAGQVASALVLAGFQVAVVCPIDSPVYKLKKLHARFPYRSWIPSASIKIAIAAWSPDILVVADDAAAQSLRSIYVEASKNNSAPDSNKLIELFEFSFGSAHSFLLAQSKSEILSLAASLRIACPKSSVLTDDGYGFAAKEAGIIFPLIVKTDDAWGGKGVRVVNDRSEFRAAITELSLPYNLPAGLKRVLRELRTKLLRWTIAQPRKISVQQYVAGRPCTRAVVCWKGKVLAGITVDVLATLYEFGPATIVKVIDHPEVTAAAEKLVAKLGLSGFLGFDFILDAADNSWFLEMNPRTTPICIFCTQYDDLAGSLFFQIAGIEPKAASCLVDRDAFTLFPHETRQMLQLMPNLPSEKGAPDDEPEYVRLYRVPDSKIRDWIWYI